MEALRLRRAQAMGAAMVHRGYKYQGDPFLVLGARLDVLEQQFAPSGAAVSLQAASDSCSSGVSELQDVVLPGALPKRPGPTNYSLFFRPGIILVMFLVPWYSKLSQVHSVTAPAHRQVQDALLLHVDFGLPSLGSTGQAECFL